MLYVTLTASLILLATANWTVRSGARDWRPLVTGAGIGVPVLCGLGLASIPIVVQAVLLCVALVVLVSERGPRLYLPASVVATLVAWAGPVWWAWEREQRFAELREQLPFESMEHRLPPRPPGPAGTPVESDAVIELETVAERTRWRREAALEALHEERVQAFVNSPGFGVVRMVRPGPDALLGEERTAPVPQPGEGSRKHPSAGGEPWSPEKDRPSLDRLHLGGVLDFVNPAGFGLVKDRTRVAGFRPHAMSKVPDPTTRWAVRTIDLVGLLLAEQPRAYVSANLPRMDEVRTAPTRPLDEFEAEGLAALRQGEELFVKGGDAEVRMVGAIRAAKQCVECHGGNRGDLLGAFSYRLRPKD